MKKEITQLLSTRSPEWRFGDSVLDTFLALYTIAEHDKTLLEGKPLGVILKQLFLIESKPGGPYYSNFPDSEGAQPQLFELETNKAIARFLGLYDIELPNVTDFIGESFVLENKTVARNKALPVKEQKFFTALRGAIKKRLASFDPTFRSLATNVLEQTIKRNPDKQMSLMAYYTALSLGTKTPMKLLVDMGVANIFFWTAFIIYDDFWDEDEAQDARLLPIANMFARSYTDFFCSVLPDNKKFKQFFHDVMDKLDAANVWETNTCRAVRDGEYLEFPEKMSRYGTYVQKYRAASGHIVGPVALLCLQGYTVDSAEASRFIEYFEHYLIAMQLNDDMHDWEEDLERGHISTAIDLLLRDYGLEKRRVHITADRDELRRIFWFTTLPKLAKKAIDHCHKAREALLSMKSITDPAPLLVFIENSESSAKEALHNYRQSIEFLSTFNDAE